MVAVDSADSGIARARVVAVVATLPGGRETRFRFAVEGVLNDDKSLAAIFEPEEGVRVLSRSYEL